MKQPLNVRLTNVDDFIKEKDVGQVTSTFIKMPSSDAFHPEGLFSEEIFGQVASDSRMVKFGYINLNTNIFHPRIYKNILRLKSFYGEILGRNAYAVFDEEERDFVRANEDDENASTGFAFFMDHLDKLDFKLSESLTRKDRVEIFNQAKQDNLLLINKWLVIPAGLRDYKDDYGQASTEEINKLYMSLINYTKGMPPKMSSNPMFDAMRYSIQRKVLEIHDYLDTMLSGKSGYVQRKYGRRGLALGTRNVISSADLSASSVTSPSFLKTDEAKVPLFQGAKAFQPLVVNALRVLFFHQIFDPSSEQIGLIDKDSYKLQYQKISESEKEKFLTSQGLEDMVNLFRNPELRNRPVSAFDSDKKEHYLFAAYDDGDTVYCIRNTFEFKEERKKNDKSFDPEKLRPFTWTELMYVATWFATFGKHALITRYPITGPESIFPCKVHLMSTDHSRSIIYASPFDDKNIPLPEYPIVGRNVVDSLVLHPCRLKGLGGDFDGDTCSLNGILSKEANEEIANYLKTKSAIISPNGDLNLDLATDLMELTLFNMSRTS